MSIFIEGPFFIEFILANFEQNQFNPEKVIGGHFNPFVRNTKASYFFVGTTFDEFDFQWKWKTGQERFKCEIIS